jgi:hypothetical protein
MSARRHFVGRSPADTKKRLARMRGCDRAAHRARFGREYNAARRWRSACGAGDGSRAAHGPAAFHIRSGRGQNENESDGNCLGDNARGELIGLLRRATLK